MAVPAYRALPRTAPAGAAMAGVDATTASVGGHAVNETDEDDDPRVPRVGHHQGCA